MRHSITALAAAVSLLALVAVANAVVDPFAMYGLWDVAGVNASKPATYHRVRLFKAFAVRRTRPEAIVLGSSRSHVGFGCGHAGWSRLDGPCYNLAFDGATTREMYEYLRHAQGVHPLHHVVLGIDAYHLGAGPSFTRPDFDPLVLFDPRRPRLMAYVAGDLRILTSLDTLRASLETVQQQGLAAPNWFAPDGQRIGEAFFRKVEPTFVSDGPRAYLDAIDRLEVGFQTDGLAPAGATDARAAPPADPAQSSRAYVQRIVDFCAREGIDLRIVITPAHAHQNEIAMAVGAGSSIEDGKREVVRMVSRAAAGHDPRRLAVWDFSGYSSVTTEALPPVGSRQEMRYYWDSSHFKSAVGDFVLDRVLEVPHAERIVPADFGQRLTPDNIEAILQQQRTARTEYVAQHRDDIERIRALVASRLR